jgi:ATP-binding protein involved in chromosome partitioning
MFDISRPESYGSAMPASTEEILNVFRAVTDPTSGKRLSELGELSRADIGPEGRAELDVALVDAAHERKEAIAELLEQAVRALEGVSDVALRIRLDPGTRSIPADDPVPGVKSVVLVMSGKGGVGKSTIATNLAVGLARSGARVGLLDADLYGPSVPTMLGASGRLMGDGQKIIPIERLGIKLVSIGFLLEDAHSAVVWRGPMLHGALVQFLRDVDWGTLDYLVLDLPPGTGDVAITLSQKVKASGAVLVTTPQRVAVDDVVRVVTMCEKMQIPVLGVVENQSYFVCEHGVRYELFGAGGGRRVAELAAAPLLGQIPLHPLVRQWGDDGTPVVAAEPDSPIAEAFCRVVDSLVVRVAQEHARIAREILAARPAGGGRRLPVLR